MRSVFGENLLPKNCWGWIWPGGQHGLQTRCEAAILSLVCSIRTHSRHFIITYFTTSAYNNSLKGGTMNFSMLPKVDRVLEEAAEQIKADQHSCSQQVLTTAVREAISFLRQNYSEESDLSKEELFALAVEQSKKLYFKKMQPSLRRVINATGVILHTNLGRAPLAPSVAQAVFELSSGYCNLEMNLENGKRGSRYDHVRELLKDLTGAEDALVVNNNAAAVMVTLDTLAKGGEAIVSRGQLVEIGGSFRIPDIIERSAATLREVGTTNKTHLVDYERAIGESTSCLLQVHPSNYHMIGFVETVDTKELAKLAHKHDLPLIYDLGSGCLYPFAACGVGQEPLPREILAAGTDVLTFSGDKLLGGPQAGIIAGKKSYIEAIMHNQMLRALRVDKMTLGALEATLALYRDGKEKEIPTVAMLTVSTQKLKARAQKLLASLKSAGIKAVLEARLSPVGGGSMPDVELPAFVVEVAVQAPDEVLSKLRAAEPAVLAYIHEDKVCFDVRTVGAKELEELGKIAKEVLA